MQCLSAALLFGIKQSLDVALLSKGHWLLILVRWEIWETKRACSESSTCPLVTLKCSAQSLATMGIVLGTISSAPLGLGITCREPSLVAEVLVFSQTIAPERGQGGEVIVLFFPSTIRQRWQVQVKVNYEFHPWQNPIINFTLPEMPLEVGFALFGMQTDSFCLWCIQEDISIKDSLTMGAHSDLHFNSFSLSADMQLIFQGQTPINPDISCLRIMLIIY